MGVSIPERDYIFPSNYFPVPERYITISNSGPPAKRYEYFSEVLELVGNLLNINGLRVFQIGDNNDPPIQGAIDFRSKLSIHQTAFVVQNSKLFIGSDNVYLHFAKDIPSVLLNNVFPKQNVIPKKGSYKPIVLEPDREGQKWSFNLEDRIINKIKPEDVAHAILKQLKITSPINFETIRIGEHYKTQAFDYIPDFDFDPNQFKQFGAVSCRLDLHFDVVRFERLVSFLPTRVSTKENVPIEILRKNRDRILEFVYFVDGELDEEYVDQVTALGFNFAIVCENKKLINDYRLTLLGKNFVHERKIPKNPLDKDNFSNNIRSSKVYLGRGKMYPTLWHYRNEVDYGGKPFEAGNLLENEEVLVDLEHFYIFKHTK